MWFSFRLLLAVTRLLPRERRDLMLENLALRHQLAIYQRSPRRPVLEERDRRFWSTLARGWSSWRGSVSVVQPDTVVRWHRMAWRRYWTWKSRRRGSGRPRIPSEVQALIRRMARENPTWGAVRIVGELRALGIDVGASTVRAYRRQALRRPPSPSWRTFLRLHAPQIWAADFFTRAAGIGIEAEAVLTPIHAPQANALAERVIGTIRRECLDHLIAVNERHLRGIVREYVAYYNAVRPHRSLALCPPAGPRELPPPAAHDRVVANPVLGGLHHVYEWAA